MYPSQQTTVITDAQILGAMRRADVTGLLALPPLPKPPRWPLFAAVFAVTLAVAGFWQLWRTELHYSFEHCDPHSEVCR